MPATRKNGISQRNFCARNRPNGTPSAAAAAKAVMMTPMPDARRCGGTMSPTMAMMVAPETPPNAPQIAREMSSMPAVCDKAQARVPQKKPA